MKITADDIFKSLEKLGVRKGFPFRSEPIPPRDEEDRLLLRARGMTQGSGLWGTDAFIKQAQFLEHFAPEMREFVPCETLPGGYESPYNAMSMAQLKYYFSWRAAFRNSREAQCDGGYAELYFRETLLGIGAVESEKLGIWARLVRTYPDLPVLCHDWLCIAIIDQYVISGDDMPFWLRMAEKGLTRHDFGPFYEYDQRMLPGSFSYALQRTNYDPRRSKFLKETDLPRLERAYDAACKAVFDLLDQKKIKSEIILWGRNHKNKNWSPLLIPYVRYQSPKIRRSGDVVISATERYSIKKSECAQYRSNPWNAHLAVILGYILKRCEARMRIHDKYRYHLNPSPETFRKNLFHAGLRYKQFSELLDSGEFDRAMDAAIDAALKPEPPRPKAVKVDFSKLADIRRDADIVRAELTVEESALHEPAQPVPIVQVLQPEAAPQPVPPETEAPKEQSPCADTPMGQFLSALSDGQRQAVASLLRGESAEKAAGSVMAEVFWEEINEHSLDILGDTVYNADEMTIYEDYAGELKDLLGI